ncbi:MAG: VanZ family protein [Fibrobacter sp.]|jgi:VanZ family protein|nr:VanZ family protein [Fibrobacter sp.]
MEPFTLSRYPILRYLPSILIMAFLFYGSSKPGSGMTWLVPPYDKMLHGFIYACLGISYALWWKPAAWESKRILGIFWVTLICLIFGLSDEFHQSFIPGRSASTDDLIADAVGGLVGALVFALLKPWKRFKIFR